MVWSLDTGAEKEKYEILGKTVKIIKTPLARHTDTTDVSKPQSAVFSGFFSDAVKNDWLKIQVGIHVCNALKKAVYIC